MAHLEQLKEKILSELPNLDVVIGWEMGYDPLTATPLFIRKPEDVERLVIGPFCANNLATFLPGMKDKKVGIVVKGCDSRAVIELLQEKLINKDNVIVFGLTCEGVISQSKVKKQIGGSLGHVTSAEVEGDNLKLVVKDKEHTLPLSEIKINKCENCRFPNAMIYDHLIGEPKDRDDAVKPIHTSIDEFDDLGLDERFAFWKQEFSRCIRCYACRNACPMCVCRDHCVATSREPHWLSQENTVAENWMFQMIHVMHLTGRCVICGECERACPMDIPLMLLRRKMNKEVRNVFNYDAGLDPNGTPPLLTFKVEEDNIPEREW